MDGGVADHPLPREASARPASNWGLTRITTGAPGRGHLADQHGDGPGHRDEREIGGDQVDRATPDGVQGDVADVQPLEAGHPGVGSQPLVELAPAHVDGDDRGGAGLEQAVGEPAGGGAGIEGPQAGRRRWRTGPGRRASFSPPRLTNRGRRPASSMGSSAATRRAGLSATDPDTSTAPRSISADGLGAALDQAPLDQSPVEPPPRRPGQPADPAPSGRWRGFLAADFLAGPSWPPPSWPAAFLAGDFLAAAFLAAAFLAGGLLGRRLLGRWPSSWPAAFLAAVLASRGRGRPPGFRGPSDRAATCLARSSRLVMPTASSWRATSWRTWATSLTALAAALDELVDLGPGVAALEFPALDQLLPPAPRPGPGSCW